MLGQREIATADDEDYAPLFVCQILGTLKEGNLSNHPFHLDHSWPHSTQVRSLLFIDTGEANDDGTVISIVHHGRSRLYTSVTVAMVIYHTSCPAGPQYDKSHSYLHLGV